MFRHRGKSRTLLHNLKLASLLSFVAGIVNVTGLFAIYRLTTNVTGHFAYFADEMVKKNLGAAIIYLFYILSFFFGAFCSNLLIEIISKRSSRFMNIIPVSLEMIILIIIAFLRQPAIEQYADMIACALLFSMGMQNALVTSLSGSVVRTTHLTGLFTDLGIELSQLFFFKTNEQQKKLHSSIRLRLTIICFFFLGGIAGGLGYLLFNMRILLLAAVLLAGGLFYDTVKFRIVLLKRKYTG